MTWMQTHSGLKFPLDIPDPEAVKFNDIAVALARVPRFAGHTTKFYSVAQHSVLASELCDNYPREALMHDASEAYIGDICRPLKMMLGESYAEIESRVMSAIWHRFDLRNDCWDEVKRVDNLLLATEARDLLGGHCVDRWNERYGEPLSGRIVPWTEAEAYRNFCDVWGAM